MCYFVSVVVGNRCRKIRFLNRFLDLWLLGAFRPQNSQKRKKDDEQRGKGKEEDRNRQRKRRGKERESSPENRPKSGKEDEIHGSGSTRTQNPGEPARSSLGLCLRPSPTTAAQTSNRPRSYGSVEPTQTRPTVQLSRPANQTLAAQPSKPRPNV